MSWLRLWRRLKRTLWGSKPPSPRAVLQRARTALDEELAGVRTSLGRAGADLGRIEVRFAASGERVRELEQRIAAYEKVGQHGLADALRQEKALLDEERRTDERQREATQRIQEGLLRQARQLHEAFRERVERVERLLEEVEGREAQARAVPQPDQGPLSDTGRTELEQLEADLQERRARATSELEMAARERARLKG